jgi:hypothetical protein
MQPHTSWGWHGTWVGGSMSKVSGEWMLGPTWLVAAQSAMADGIYLKGCVEGRGGDLQSVTSSASCCRRSSAKHTSEPEFYAYIRPRTSFTCDFYAGRPRPCKISV